MDISLQWSVENTHMQKSFDSIFQLRVGRLIMSLQQMKGIIEHFDMHPSITSNHEFSVFVTFAQEFVKDGNVATLQIATLI